MNYTDSVPSTSEKKREKILTLVPFRSAFHQPIQDQRSAPQATGDSGSQDKKITSDGR